VLLREVEKRTNIISQFASCFSDYRDPELVEHGGAELLAQRIYGLASGYEDLNHHEELRRDPLLAVLVEGEDLTGNSGDWCAIRVPPWQARAPSTAWNWERRSWGKRSGTRRSSWTKRRWIGRWWIFFCKRWRPSNIDEAKGSVAEVERIVKQIRQAWPQVRIILPGDSGFCRDELLSWCEAQGVDYGVGLAKNARLLREIVAASAQAESQFQQSGKAARVFTEFVYQTRNSWSRARRGIAKAEHLEKGANPRFVVTSLSSQETTFPPSLWSRWGANGLYETNVI
jgi:hypothetical protein